jgi:hypothetical protein
MKKTLVIIGLALVASVINAPAQNSNSVAPALPPLVGTTNVNVNITIQPVTLTQAQMDATIALVQTTGGIQSNVPINTTNLQRLTIVRSQLGTNTFYRVIVQLR